MGEANYGRLPQAVTDMDGAPVAYHLVTTHRGTAVEVSVPHPAADEVLAVQA